MSSRGRARWKSRTVASIREVVSRHPTLKILPSPRPSPPQPPPTTHPTGITQRLSFVALALALALFPRPPRKRSRSLHRRLGDGDATSKNAGRVSDFFRIHRGGRRRVANVRVETVRLGYLIPLGRMWHLHCSSISHFEARLYAFQNM